MNFKRIDPIRFLVVIWTHCLAAYFLYTFQWWYLIPFIVMNLIFNTTITVFLHKSLGHRVWHYKSKVIDHFFALMTQLHFMGHPWGWAIMHRFHHKYLDTELDPHSPAQVGHIVSYFHLWKMPVPNRGISKYIDMKDLLKDYKHLLIYSKYPMAFTVAIWAFVGLLFGLEGLAIVGAASCFQHHSLGIIDCIVHRTPKIIHSPSKWLTGIMMGPPEGIEHLEHHAQPYVHSHIKGWFDYHARIIEILEKKGLVEIKGKKILDV